MTAKILLISTSKAESILIQNMLDGYKVLFSPYCLDAMGKIKVPIPPLPEQARIVSILDRFDALCNDLSSGLPAVIEARRKQYEYYRDKLLTFKEKAS